MSYRTAFIYTCDHCGIECEVSKELAMAPNWFSLTRCEDQEDGVCTYVADYCSKSCVRKGAKSL